MAISTKIPEENLVTLPDTSQTQPTSQFLIRRPIWIDLAVFLFIGALVFLLINAAHSITAPRRGQVVIDLSIHSLPKYVGWSLFRGFAAYCLSLVFTLVYGYIAAKNRRAEKIMIPILDILQSIPVLGFMPSVLLALIALFPDSNLGLELTAIIMIFTGQVWNMTFSFYHSLRTIPQELCEAAKIYGFGWWRTFWKLELPFAAIPLVWNSIIGVAGGWFFLTICETFKLGENDFRLPGIGSYMWEAIEKNDTSAMIYGITAMIILILLIDQLVWRPLIAWSQKFQYQESAAESSSSIILDLLKQSAILEFMGKAAKNVKNTTEDIFFTKIHPAVTKKEHQTHTRPVGYFRQILGLLFRLAGSLLMIALGIAVLIAISRLVALISNVNVSQWLHISVGASLTLTRVVATLILASLWTIPLGVIIGLKPRVSRVMQPIILILASFPAPMIYPLILKVLNHFHISLEYGSIVLLALGSQWYILFNSVAGASKISDELNQVTKIYRFSHIRRWAKLYLPAVFPSLITGWIAAAGGAWNASIVAEYIHTGGKVLSATGLGAIISMATEQKQLHLLAASVIVMAMMVVIINRIFWEPIFKVASDKFSA